MLDINDPNQKYLIDNYSSLSVEYLDRDVLIKDQKVIASASVYSNGIEDYILKHHITGDYFVFGFIDASKW